MRTIPTIELGNVFFGWNIGYENPQEVWERVKRNPTLIDALPHEVPVPGQRFWDGWVALHKVDDIVLFAPILFEDLREYRFLNRLDEVVHCPVEVQNPFRATVLLGKCIHRTAADLAGRMPALQRQLAVEAVVALRKRIAAMLRNG